MTLVLERIAQRVGAQTHLHPIDLALVPGAITVVLGATGAGKTTLLRLMAGLDAPTSGRLRSNGIDVTKVPVRERNIAMVYQQFINYPSLTVAENIASPLRRQRTPKRDAADIAREVRSIATRLRIDPFLGRLPSSLSGGQQQRVALARALVKRAPLVLLDEPLVNLDYKLREELRDELGALFSNGESTVVYATTEPSEALLLGGYTAVLDRGELLQYGPTSEVHHRPNSLRVARAFNDPPMNLLPGALTDGMVRVAPDVLLPLPQAYSAPLSRTGECTVGIRASAIRLEPREGDVAITGTVALADITGSDTFVHLTTATGTLVIQLAGVIQPALGVTLKAYVPPGQVFLFAADGSLRHAPSAKGH